MKKARPPSPVPGHGPSQVIGRSVRRVEFRQQGTHVESLQRGQRLR